MRRWLVSWNRISLVMATLWVITVATPLGVPKGYQLFYRAINSGEPSLDVKHLPRWLKEIPDGIPQKSSVSAEEGVPNKERTPEVENLFQLSGILEAKAHSLGAFIQEPSDFQLKNAYLLEGAVVDLIYHIGNESQVSLSSWERARLLYDLSQTYGVIRTHAKRMSQWVQWDLDAKLPGGTGLRYPLIVEDSLTCNYLNNCRTDKVVTEEERKKFYEEKKVKFLSKGGSLSEMFVLDRQSIPKLSQQERLEYVQRENGEIWVTPGTAGHVLLSGGEGVKAAGQMLLIKNSSGQWDFVVVSSGSGSFRPYRFSVDQFRNSMSEAIGYPKSQIIVTDDEPLAPLLIKLSHKARGTKPEIADEILDTLSEQRKDFKKFLSVNAAFKPKSEVSSIARAERAKAGKEVGCSNLLKSVGTQGTVLR